jgi:23S rRNA pseudouridine1911/1915/1917 synthase
VDDTEGLHRWEVPAALGGERVDRALSLITGLARSDVNALIDAGRVRLAGRIVTARSKRVQPGQRLEAAGGGLDRVASGGPEADPSVEVPVVFSDDQVIVVDKPAGLVVHPGAGHRSGTLVNGLLARFPGLSALATEPGQADRPGIVHRLDKGTSGLLVVARTLEARRSLISQLASRSVDRQYLTLVAGTVEADAGLIDGPLGRSDLDPTRVRVQTGGRQARTRYHVEARYASPEPATLLRCRLETGRTHQIRVHLASIGHPVIGDDRYGVTEVKGWRPLPPGRPFLHAARLAFEHPETGERLSFSSPLPEDLLRVTAGMRHPT